MLSPLANVKIVEKKTKMLLFLSTSTGVSANKAIDAHPAEPRSPQRKRYERRR